MLMIIAHHFTLKSGALLETYGVNQIITIILYIGGKVGSNIFVIIGAYFLIDARSNISRAIKIWGGDFILFNCDRNTAYCTNA